MKWLTSACALCLVAVLVTVYVQLGSSDIEVPIGSAGTVNAASTLGGGTLGGGAAGARGAAPDATATTQQQLAADLQAARRSCRPEPLDALIDRLDTAIARDPEDAFARRLCAEAILERVLLRGQHRGIVVGEPVYDELPQETVADIEKALALLADAREHGDDSADSFRIEAVLLSNRITGFPSALQWNGRIQQALRTAADRDAQNPALHVTLGLRKLLAPRWLGHDPEKALEHLTFAADAMQSDERPGVFAAMACYLLRKRQQAIAWLERAVERNPNNVFARAVLARVQRGEPDPFARDLSEAEVR